MRPIQPLVRLPHSHIDPNWLSTVERASRTPPREFYEWVADHILSVIGSLPGSRLVGSDLRAWHRVWTDYGVLGNYSGPDVPLWEASGNFHRSEEHTSELQSP